MKKKQREFEVGDVYDPSIAKKTIEVRKDTMESLSYDTKKEGYTKNLSNEEITDRRESLSNVCININDIEERKKEVMDEFKSELSGPKSEQKELLNSIKHKSEYRNGNLYYIDDQENGFMYIFDENCECIDSRPLKPTEKQTKLKSINQEQKTA